MTKFTDVELNEKGENTKVFNPAEKDGSTPPPLTGEEAKEAAVHWAVWVLEEVWGKRFFLYCLILTVAVAAAYPPAGRKGGPLKPKISVSWIAVIVIFLVTGLKLKTQELRKAALFWRLNIYVICFTYVFIPLSCYVVSLLLRLTSYNTAIIDGIIVMSCLPTTISMCVILSKTALGNEAASVFNATVSNFLGIFFTPSLLLLILGQSGSVSMVTIIFKLGVRVIVPVTAGQLIRITLPAIVPWVTRNGKRLKRFSELLLLFIVYAVFCETFYTGVDAKPEEFAILLAILLPLHLFFLGVCFSTARLPLFNFKNPDIVSVLFCSTEKTVAMGIPLITAMYEDSPNLGIFSVPLLIYHPMQLVIGSLLVGKLAVFATANDEEKTDLIEKNHGDTKEFGAPPGATSNKAVGAVPRVASIGGRPLSNVAGDEAKGVETSS